MRQARRAAALVLLATALVAGPAGAGTAAATSCVGYDHGPMELAEDGEIGRAAAASYDGVVLGTVTSVSGRQQGPVDVAIDVTGTFGPPLPSRVEIESPDDGQMSGYGFVTGRHYLVPYRVEGDRMTSFVCDPIFEVLPAEVPALVAAADRGAWPRPPGSLGGRLGVLVDGVATPGLSGPVGGWPLVIGALLVGTAGLVLAVRSLSGRGVPPVDERLDGGDGVLLPTKHVDGRPVE